MSVAVLLEMTAQACPDRVAVGSAGQGVTYQALHDRAVALGNELCGQGVAYVALLGVNSDAVPLLVFATAYAGLPFVPLNYRLADAQLHEAVDRISPAIVFATADQAARLGHRDGVIVVDSASLLDAPPLPARGASANGSDAAVLLFTSGTSGQPKAAVLRAQHLLSYVLSATELLVADEAEATLISVPPYHVAGISSVLTSVYSGRRMVQLAAFEADEWVRVARDERVTHAMVVPTMLGRLLDVLEADSLGLPALRHLAYGGGRMPLATVERAIRLLPEVDFVNAYGLTETSSTIAVLGPDDHREALTSPDPDVRRRLGSVGRPVPAIELEVRDPQGAVVPVGVAGELFVRGEQVSGEYTSHSALDAEGWFPTRDRGFIDESGFLYVDGRADDVIVRGAENISPGEVEDVLVQHPDVAEAAVVGAPSAEWGEHVIAFVVRRSGSLVEGPALQEWVRARLRSAKTPSEVRFTDALPYNETGKLLRRELRDQLRDQVQA